MENEQVKSSDFKLVKYRDPETGKIKFRKKRTDDAIVQQEKAVSKAQQKFFGMVRAKQKGEMPNASPEIKKAAASMSKKDVKDFAATKHKGLPAKKESTDAYGKSMDAIANKKKKAAISKPDLDKLSKLKDLMKKANEGFAVKYNNPGHEKHGREKHFDNKMSADKHAARGNKVDKVGGKYTVHKTNDKGHTVEATMADKNGPGKGKDMRDMSKLDHAKARDYHQYRVKTKGDYHSKMAKIHHANAIGGSSMLHKEDNIKELSPDTVKRYRDKASDDQPRQKRIAHDYATRTGDNKSDWTDKMAKVHQRAADNRSKGIARANSRLAKEDTDFTPRDTNVLKTFEDFKSDLAKRKAANLAKRGARRGPAKGTAKKDGDWDQKAAKPLDFEIKSNDHHSTVHNTLAKAADAMHPSLGGRKVSLKIGGKTKVYSNHKDLQHVVDYHSKLKDKGQKADLMRSVRSGGHEAISKHTSVYRKVTKQ